MNPTCSTCRYWQIAPTGTGICRRYAPKPAIIMQAPGLPIGLVWPGTKPDEWCGEHLVQIPDPA